MPRHIDHLVIRPHRPWRIWLTLLLLPLILVGVGMAGFEAGRRYSDDKLAQMTTALGNDRTLARKLKIENDKLHERMLSISQNAGIDRNACSQLRLDLERQQIEILGMEEDLAFYRGIITPPNGLSGLQIHELTIDSISHGRYRGRLSLTQLQKQKEVASGTISIRVSGNDTGQRDELEGVELGIDQPPIFSFLYFQYIDFEFSLPDTFRPMRITITLQVRQSARDRKKSQTAKQVSRDFEWSEVTSLEAADHAEWSDGADPDQSSATTRQ